MLTDPKVLARLERQWPSVRHVGRPAGSAGLTGRRLLLFPLRLALFTHPALSQGLGNHTCAELHLLPSPAAWVAAPPPAWLWASPRLAGHCPHPQCARFWHEPSSGFLLESGTALQCDCKEGPGCHGHLSALGPWHCSRCQEPQPLAHGNSCFSSQSPYTCFLGLGCRHVHLSSWFLCECLLPGLSSVSGLHFHVTVCLRPVPMLTGSPRGQGLSLPQHFGVHVLACSQIISASPHTVLHPMLAPRSPLGLRHHHEEQGMWWPPRPPPPSQTGPLEVGPPLAPTAV